MIRGVLYLKISWEIRFSVSTRTRWVEVSSRMIPVGVSWSYWTVYLSEVRLRGTQDWLCVVCGFVLLTDCTHLLAFSFVSRAECSTVVDVEFVVVVFHVVVFDVVVFVVVVVVVRGVVFVVFVLASSTSFYL